MLILNQIITAMIWMERDKSFDQLTEMKSMAFALRLITRK